MSDDTIEPIQLVEDEATGDRFLVYGSDKGMRLDIRFEGETLWMTQAQIAELFGKDRTSVTKHIANIFSEGELDEETCVKKVHTTPGRPPTLYNLDMVVSVGYRVSSIQATFFRRWSTAILVQYAKKGFVVDAVRLKNPDFSDRIKELRETIRDIRSEEANVYRELSRICKLCQDYEAGSAQTRDFYKHTQAKLVFAVTSQTPAEVVMSRADTKAPNMGLQTWPHVNIRKNDVTVSKNYLAEAEIRELNRLTNLLLDIFEDQAEIGKLVVIRDAATLLDAQLLGLNRAILKGGGQVNKQDADKKALAHYAAYKEQQKQLRHDQADQSIQALAKEAKELPKSRKRT